MKEAASKHVRQQSWNKLQIHIWFSLFLRNSHLLLLD